jgi:ZIP family zinc transporter
LATFAAALTDPHWALPSPWPLHPQHPEGIAVSVPIFYATEAEIKRLSIRSYPACQNLSERWWGSDCCFCSSTRSSGRALCRGRRNMVFISLDELLPAAREYGEHHLSIYGVVAGMAVMAASLAMFE